MSSVRTLIVDDEPLARERIRTLLASVDGIEVVGECEDGRRAATAIVRDRPDLVFLDVQMPELDGFEVIRTVGLARMPAVIFVTAYDQYAVRAFEAHALDYLLKPFDRSRFDASVRRAIEQLRPGKAPSGLNRRMLKLLEDMERRSAYARRLVIKREGRVLFVPVVDIDWVEAADNYVRVHVGREVHLMRATMSHIESVLDPDQFVRVHRSAIVNIARIREVQPWFHGDFVVILNSGTKVTTSRGYRRSLARIMKTP